MAQDGVIYNDLLVEPNLFPLVSKLMNATDTPYDVLCSDLQKSIEVVSDLILVVKLHNITYNFCLSVSSFIEVDRIIIIVCSFNYFSFNEKLEKYFRTHLKRIYIFL